MRAVVGVLLLTFALMLASCGGPDNPPGSAALVAAVPIQASTHVPVGSQIAYQQQPSTSGPHYPVTADNGIYTDVVPEAYWVHNLEHGAIVALYRRPTGQEQCPDVSNRLQTLMEAAPPSERWGVVKMVGSQYPALTTPYALLAWGRIMPLDEYNQDRMLEFHRQYVDKGPEDVR